VAASQRPPSTSTRRISRTPNPATRDRGNLTWHITPDTMVYYTFSQGFPTGWLQPERRLLQLCPGPGWRESVRGSQDLLLRQADQQRDRLEDRISRSSPAVERGRVPGELGQTSRSLSFDPGVTGNIFFDTKRPELPHQGRRDFHRGARGDRTHPAGGGLVEPRAGRRIRRR